MFCDAFSFNQDIGNWNVGKVLNMHMMFLKARDFNQDISRWCILPNTNVESMFSDAKSFNGKVVTKLNPETNHVEIKIVYHQKQMLT